MITLYSSALWLAHAIDVQAGSFTASCVTAAQVIADDKHLQTLCITLHGFDTHEDQLQRNAALLAQGLASMRTKLTASGDWKRTLVISVSEFRRSAYENIARGTDHGTAASQFLLGAGHSR